MTNIIDIRKRKGTYKPKDTGMVIIEAAQNGYIVSVRRKDSTIIHKVIHQTNEELLDNLNKIFKIS